MAGTVNLTVPATSKSKFPPSISPARLTPSSDASAYELSVPHTKEREKDSVLLSTNNVKVKKTSELQPEDPKSEKTTAAAATPMATRKSRSEVTSTASETELQPTRIEGIAGDNSEYVVLVSSDFQEFIIRRTTAYMSPSLRRMFEYRKKVIQPWNVSEVLVNYPSLIVSKVCEYLIYKEYYEQTLDDAAEFTVNSALVLEVLMAAQFLDI